MSDFDDFGSMQSTLIGKVISVTKYDVSSEVRGGYLWMTKPNNGSRDDVLGEQIIKVGMPFEMFDHLEHCAKESGYLFPGIYKIVAEVNMGSGNKATFKAITIEPYSAPASKMAEKPSSTTVPSVDKPIQVDKPK